MKNCLAVLLIMIISTTVTLAGDNSSRLRVGTLIYNPPYETAVLNKNFFFGFNIEVINTICQTMKKKCQLIPMRFDELMTALNNNQLDVLIVGISLRPQDKVKYIESYPYFIGHARLLALRKSHIKTLDNKTIGIVKRTITPLAKNVDIITDNSMHLKHSDTLKIMYFRNLPSLLTALNNKTVDVIVLDAGAAWYWQQQSSKRYEVIGPVISLPKGMTIVALAEQENLINTINKSLEKMEKNGSLLNIYKKYWRSIHPSNKAQAQLIPIKKNQYRFNIPAIPSNNQFRHY